MDTMEAMSEFGRCGGQRPHERASRRERFEDLEEDVRHEPDAERAARARPERPVEVLGEALALTT